MLWDLATEPKLTTTGSWVYTTAMAQDGHELLLDVWSATQPHKIPVLKESYFFEGVKITRPDKSKPESVKARIDLAKGAIRVHAPKARRQWS